MMARHSILTFMVFCLSLSPPALAELSQAEQADLLYNQALKHHQIQELNLAEDKYLEALKLQPNFVEASNNLGSLYLSQRKEEKALAIFQRALKYWKVDPDLYFNLGLSYLALEQNEQAQDAFEKAVQLNKDHPAQNFFSKKTKPFVQASDLDKISMRIQSLLSTQQTEKAQELLAQALKKHPQSPRLHYYQARLSPDAALRLQHLKTCLKYKPNHVGALYLKSQSLMQLQKHQAARDSLMAILEIRPRFIEAYDDLAQMARKTGNTQAAAHWLKQLLVLAPDYQDAPYRLGQYLNWLGHPQEALLYLHQQSKSKPHMPAHLLSFDILLKLNKLDAAAINLKQAQQIWSAAPEVYLRQAALALRQNDHEGFLAAIPKAPAGQGQTRFLKAQFAMRQGNTGEAIRLLQVLRQNSNKTEYTELLLLALIKAERHSEALTIARKQLSAEAFRDFQKALSQLPPSQQKGHFNAHNSSRR